MLCDLGGQLYKTTPVPARTGIIQEITVLDSTFSAQGTSIDGVAVQTWDTSDNSYQAGDAGGTWDSNWNTTRVDLFSEEGFNGPETDDALRIKLEYDIPYTDEQNAPRDKVFWSPGGFSSGLDCDVEYWLSFALIIPAGYENDSEFSRETLLQLHNDSTAAGIISLVIDKGTLKLLSRTTATSTSGGTERKHIEQSVNTDKGEIT